MSKPKIKQGPLSVTTLGALYSETHDFKGGTLRIAGNGKKHCRRLSVGLNAGIYIVELDTTEKYPDVTSVSQSGPDGRWSGFAVFFKNYTRMEVCFKGDWDTATYQNRYGPTMWFIPSFLPGGHTFLFDKEWRFKSR